MRWLSNAKNFILEALFPSECLNCRKETAENALCATCQGTIPVFSTLFCPVCKLRLADNKAVCHKNAGFLLGAAAPYHHDAVKSLIHYFKYEKWQRLAGPLSGILAAYLTGLEYDFSGFAAIPVPLHPSRKRERGFNQSELLARHAATMLDIPLLSGNLCRIKETSVQAELGSFDQRQKNVAGCFSVSDANAINGNDILLVDDVFTSGATMSEAARTLKKAGAKKIIALVIAKA